MGKVSLNSKKTEMDNYRENSYKIIPASPFKNQHSYCKILPNEKEEQRDMILNSFDMAQDIRLVRETKGLTIEKLAELAGV